MQKGKSVIDIPGFWGGTRRLYFQAEGLNIERLKSFDAPVFLPADDIAAFRFEIKWLRGYRVAIGRQYSIDIQRFSGQITSLKLRSIYGIKKQQYHQLWNDILQLLWQHYFVNLLNYYRELKNMGQYFELGGVQFHSYGIAWENEVSMFWHEIALASYTTYFMIYRADYNKHRKSCSYAADWNAVVLQTLLQEIIEEEKELKKSI